MTHRIVILGFMASGKTTVGQELARQLDCTFVDLDSLITARDGRSPAEIIKADGEGSFREIETSALCDVLQNQQAEVIALGGGTWTVPANRTLLSGHNYMSIWLDAPFELCWQRISADEQIRPLAPDRAAALARYEARASDYALANRRIKISESDVVESITGQILREP